MVTTIQVNEDLKKVLNRLKGKKETYESVIINLVKFFEEQKRKKEEFLIEGAKATAGESLEITKKFESIEGDFCWEW